jgi:sulfur transfer complex TusBCD TusB component (DsrH family)
MRWSYLLELISLPDLITKQLYLYLLQNLVIWLIFSNHYLDFPEYIFYN